MTSSNKCELCGKRCWRLIGPYLKINDKCFHKSCAMTWIMVDYIERRKFQFMFKSYDYEQ